MYQLITEAFNYINNFITTGEFLAIIVSLLFAVWLVVVKKVFTGANNAIHR